jgi:hypothetical protein
METVNDFHALGVAKGTTSTLNLAFDELIARYNGCYQNDKPM